MQHLLTLIAPPGELDPTLVARLRDALSGTSITTLADREAADISLPAPPDMDIVRDILAGVPIDAVTTQTTNRRKRLLIADMDSTIVTGETLDELADFAGLKDRIAAITSRAMNGEIDFPSALRERVAMLKGLPLGTLQATWERVRLTEGARELVATMRAHGALTALVSGGFTFFTGRVAELAGFDLHRANVLLDDGSHLIGRVAEPILDRNAKLGTLQELAAARHVPLEQTMAVGDGANDLPMLQAAGLGVAFRAKPIVAADARARVDHTNLRALLFIQGYSAGEIASG
ncbi:MAG: phosphoserine phosphatase SerB [Acetobacteraceae bacterium]|nr:phosphoserine phosphatase SerB [Acetobacteraceae bacterium]